MTAVANGDEAIRVSARRDETDKVLARVFDRFYKVDTSRAGTATPSGSGLGLSIVRAIVLRHGGTVAASAGAFGGARFEIVLPDDAKQQARQAQSGSSAP